MELTFFIQRLQTFLNFLSRFLRLKRFYSILNVFLHLWLRRGGAVLVDDKL